MKLKFITIILFISFILINILSCGESDNINKNNENAGTNTESGTETSEEDLSPEIKNLDGYNYRIMTGINEGNSIYVTNEMNGDTINDAVYLRNRSVEEKYNIIISNILLEDRDALAEAYKKNVQANEDFADIILLDARLLFPIAQQGMMQDWYSFPEVRLDMSWWDQRIQQELEIKDKLYTIIGEFSTFDDLGTMTVFYNKTLADDFQFDNIYDMVKNGSWTFDNFWNMLIQVSEDTNGDGVMDQNDRYGFITEYSALYYFYSGSGYRSIQPKGNNQYELVIGTEKAINIVDKVIKIGTEKYKHTVISDDGKLVGSYDTAKAMFSNNQSLFYAGSFGDIANYRNMESDFGVLPIPKYDELQEDYYCLVTWNVQPATMPITAVNPNDTALILEAISYESSLGLTDAFYNVFLEDKLSRDEETKEMFDIIFASKTYDLDWYAGISGFLSIMNTIGQTGVNNFVSEYAKIENVAQAKLEEFLSNFN